MTAFLYHIPVLIVIVPLTGALLCPVIGHFNLLWAKRSGITALFLSMVMASLQLAYLLMTDTVIHYHIGGWAPPYGIEFVVDPLNGIIILLVAVISWTTCLFSSPVEKGEPGEGFRSAGYYSMVCFLGLGLMGMSVTGDVFNLYVFMEVTAISGYGLIAAGEEKGPIAAFRYLMTGTVGACMYLLGTGFLYAASGTLNMDDLAAMMPELADSPLIILSVGCLIIGFGIKMALFPLHGWQPAAHSYAHTAADPMIAGIMIKVPAYVMLRFFFYLFDETSPVMETFLSLLGVMAVCGVLFGSLKALGYDTYNKILAYSSIGQVGYIAMGFAIGNFYGLIGATLHIISHALMKSGLFYTSGALKYRYGVHYTDELGQIYRQMPVTSFTMSICALSMIGLPPFAGFFSKWYLALGAIENGQYIYVAVLIISSLLSAVYFFRILERMFMGEKSSQEKNGFGKQSRRPENGLLKKDVPWQMLLPMAVTAGAIIFTGLFNAYIVDDVLKYTVSEVLLR